jgi:hypothetical protein
MFLHIVGIFVSDAALTGEPLLVVLDIRHKVPYSAPDSSVAKNAIHAVAAYLMLRHGRNLRICTRDARADYRLLSRITAVCGNLAPKRLRIKAGEHSVYDSMHHNFKVNSPALKLDKKDNLLYSVSQCGKCATVLFPQHDLHKLVHDNTKPSARMGRKAHWVSRRQPGCRNIIFRQSGFLLSRSRPYTGLSLSWGEFHAGTGQHHWLY